MKYCISLCLILVFLNFTFSQSDSLNSFHPPLDIPLTISANFGELRPNHFHMGIDFRTNNKIGLPIHSIEEGYVSRIKISSVGYGKVIYIDHPSGITSVYAHCSSFSTKIDSVLQIKQKEEQANELDLLFPPNEIKVLKGEIISFSGNTGNSTGPHLHFEIRDTKTEIALNPFLFGFDDYDTLSPSIKSLKIYALTKEGYVWKGKSKIIPVIRNKNSFSIANNQIIIPSNFCSPDGGIGFAIESCDHINRYTHEFSDFGHILTVDNEIKFIHENDEISFDGTKFINTQEDIVEHKKSKKEFIKSFRSKQNFLESNKGEHSGIIQIHPKDTFAVKYLVYDARNNQSQLKFNLIAQDGPENNQVFNITNCLIPSENYAYKDSLREMELFEGCVYEPTPINLRKENGMIGIGKYGQAIQSPISVKLKITNSEFPIEKYFIKNIENGKYQETIYEDGWLSCKSKTFGSFVIDIDTIAPVISPLNFQISDSIIKKSYITWKINDSKTILKDFDLFVDDNWEIMDYESKGNYATFKLLHLTKGKHYFKLIAKDACGNVAIFEKELWIE